MKENVKINYLGELCKSVFGGICVCTGATAYFTVDNYVFGVILFTLGLFSIYTLKFNLYTGKVGFLFEDKNPLLLLIIWLGNFLGIIIFSSLIKLTKVVKTTDIIDSALKSSNSKLSDSLLSVFILACFCGFLMYVAAKAFKLTQDTPNSVGGYMGMVLCVAGFLVAGYEHSIANMYYFSLASVWSVNAFIHLFIVTMGNAVGALFVPTIKKIIKED